MAEKRLQVVNRTDLHYHVGLGARLLHMGLEDIVDMLGPDIHLERALILIDDHVRGPSLIDIFDKLGIVLLHAHRSVAQTSVLTSREEGHGERYDNQRIDPVHIELGHTRSTPIVCIHWFLIIH